MAQVSGQDTSFVRDCSGVLVLSGSVLKEAEKKEKGDSGDKDARKTKSSEGRCDEAIGKVQVCIDSILALQSDSK